MVLKFIIFLFIVLSASNCIADTHKAVEEKSYIDKIHQALSEKIIDYSNTIDYKISNIFTNNEKTNSIDSFFKNNKFIDETDNAFVSFRTKANFQSKYKNKYSFEASAHLPLSRSKKKLNLFIYNINNENTKNLANDEDNTILPEIGIDYFAPKLYNIQSKYSIGFKGLNLFIRARYYRSFIVGNWKIEPIQTFKLSVEDKYQEDTYIYFDTKPKESTLFRVVLYRKSETYIDGIDYSIAFKHYWNISTKSILSLSQTFFGNTKYKFITNSLVVPQETKNYSKIHNYTSSLGFRQNIWKKWFFYEINPSINFHKENFYKPNYALVFLLDFNFGSL